MAETMPRPTIAQKAPCPVGVQAGKTFWWCACWMSKKQPFRDGNHKGGAFSPVQYTAEKDGTAWFGGKAPLCDGRHKAL